MTMKLTLPQQTILERIIWSADVSKKEVLELTDPKNDKRLPPGLNIKLDRLFFEDLSKKGKGIIKDLQNNGYRVFVDAKIIEIPDKCIELANKYLVHKPWMLNIMAGAISTGFFESNDVKKIDALKRFADACHKVGTRPCAVTVLTSKTDQITDREDGEFQRTCLEQVAYYVDKLINFGFTDIVCSPLEAEKIKEAFGYRLKVQFNDEEHPICLNTPGVRMPQNAKGDQARVMTPAAAFEAGADRLVIGRPITEGGNFEQNLFNIINNALGAV